MTNQAADPAALVAALAERHPELRKACPCEAPEKPWPIPTETYSCCTACLMNHADYKPIHGVHCICHGLGYLPVSLLEAASVALEQRVVTFLDYDGLDGVWFAATSNLCDTEAETWYEATVRAWAKAAGVG